MATTLPRTTKSKASATNTAKRASELLGLNDEKSLTIAILEAALEEIGSNRRFAEKIRVLYDVLTTTKTTNASQKSTKTKIEEEHFTPLKYVEGIDLNVAVTPDPFLMCEAYGAEQFQRMLQRDNKTRLLDNIRLIQEKRPGAKLPNKAKATKDEIINFIICQVTK
jgi:hypothetical protein